MNRNGEINFTEILLVLIVIVVLYYAFLGPIKTIYNSFQSIGGIESSKLVQMKKTCDGNPTQSCAIEVAQESLKEGEEPLVVESWLRKEIAFAQKNSIKDTTYLTNILIFAQTLYQQSKDYNGGIATYEQFAMLTMPQDFRNQVTSAELGAYTGAIKEIYDKISAGKHDAYVANKAELDSLVKSALILFRANAGKVEDIQITGNPDACNQLYSLVNEREFCYTDLRESLANGCYGSFGKGCLACSTAPKTGDPCSIYTFKDSCNTDPCNTKEQCKWQGSVDFSVSGTSCVSGKTFLSQG